MQVELFVGISFQNSRPPSSNGNFVKVTLWLINDSTTTIVINYTALLDSGPKLGYYQKSCVLIWHVGHDQKVTISLKVISADFFLVYHTKLERRQQRLKYCASVPRLRIPNQIAEHKIKISSKLQLAKEKPRMGQIITIKYDDGVLEYPIGEGVLGSRNLRVSQSGVL
jgi:hypothetical protein